MSKAPDEHTGGEVNYYKVEVARPIHLPAPYVAECVDIIVALDMSFEEGEAFKAIWRRAAAKTLGKKKRGYKDGLYDAEKVAFYGSVMIIKDRCK